MNLRSLAALGGAALLLAAVPFAQQNLRPQLGVKRTFTVPGHDTSVRLWVENKGGVLQTMYELSVDGSPFTEPIEAQPELLLRRERFDPKATVPVMNPTLQAPAGNRLFIVQYWTRFQEDYGTALEERGVEIHRYMPYQANVVEMDPSLVREVRSLPFVRSVTPFHPVFKLEEELNDAVEAGATGPITLNVLTMRRGDQAPVIQWVEDNGGTVESISKETYLMVVTVDQSQIPALAALSSVQWLDRWSPETPDMNIARIMHGADYVESVAGYTGTGLRAEVRDIGCSTTHQDLPNFLVHGSNNQATHGTSTSGIVFGKGIGNANARGTAPDGFLVIQNINFSPPGGSRYAATGQIADPSGPYRCVFQTNSVGSSQTTQYNSVSQNLDLILFDFDHTSVTQSQSNLNNQNSRPEAWAKNVISVGGINHFNTLTKNDDRWGGASIGPAADGRIKPDLASYYDAIWTTTSPNGYTTGFGGTSGATPIVAGHMGLFYQMWNDGLFGNPTPGSDIFENAPNNTTAKAMMINTASQWAFSGTTHNLTRVHQGWGHPDLQYMYDNRNNMLIVDEDDVLGPFQTMNYYVNVDPGQPEFRVTMVYRDPPGTTSASLHRINDIDLTVLAPDGTLYKGNNGLTAGNTSAPYGSWSTVDTVENVIVANPQAGEWRITIFSRDVNQDSHVETPALDVDYALVASPIASVIPACGTARNIARNPFGNPNALTVTPIVPGQPSTITLNTQGFQNGTIIGVAMPNTRPLDSGTVALLEPESPVYFRIGPLPGPNINVNQVLVSNPSLCGKTIYIQAKLDNGPGLAFSVTNAIDAVVGN